MNPAFRTTPWTRRLLHPGPLAVLLVAVLAWGALPAPTHAQQQASRAVGAVQAAQQAFHGADGTGKDGPLAKVGMDLARLYYERRPQARVQGTAGAEPPATLLPVQDGHVRIDAAAGSAAEAPALRVALEALGLRNGATAGVLVGGWLPVEEIAAAARLETLRFARPSVAAVRSRAFPAAPSPAARPPVVSQGVEALGADVAREQFDTRGEGTLVGVLSDSYDCQGAARGDVEAGELPPDVIVVADEAGCVSGTDEGRAMIEIIFDVAPEAGIAFNSAFNSLAGFAQGVRNLADEGADVVVDDVIYFAEPMFAVGPVGQAVNEVFDEGVTYFSSAGNSGEQSYEAPDGFRDSGQTGPSGDGTLHDFDPGASTDVYQEVVLPEGASITIGFQWDEPYATTGGSGSRSDVDIYLLDAEGNEIDGASATRNNLGTDPVEVLQLENDENVEGGGDGGDEFRLAIELFDGPAPGFMKYVYTGVANDLGEAFTLQEYDDPHSTVYGHINARGAEAVGAAAFFNTPAFNEDIEVPVVNTFSALGGTPLFFDETGARRSAPRVPRKPEIVGPDGANTSFFGADIDVDPDGDPNFFGTSAAAPHVAGVAALMHSVSAGPLLPTDVFDALESTATDMDPVRNGVFDPEFAGFDFKTGFGFVNAAEALASASSSLLSRFEAAPARGGEAIAVSWRLAADADAERFVLEQCTDDCSDTDNFTVVETIPATSGQRSYSYTYAPSPGNYFVRLRVVGADGRSFVSRVSPRDRPIFVGSFLQAFDATRLSEDNERVEVRLSIAPESEVRRVVVQRQRDGGPFERDTTVSVGPAGETFAYRTGNLPPGAYRFRLLFETANGEQIRSNLVPAAGTIDIDLLKSFTVMQLPVGQAGIRLEWSVAPNNEGYVDQAVVRAFPQGTNDFTRLDSVQIVPGQRRYGQRLADLEPGRYRFRLVFLDAEGRVVEQSSFTEQFFIELNEPVRLSEAFPNPFTGGEPTQLFVTVGGDTPQTLDVRLYDALGRQMRAQTVEVEGSIQNSISLRAAGLASGVYFIRVTGEDFLETRSVVLVQ